MKKETKRFYKVMRRGFANEYSIFCRTEADFEKTYEDDIGTNSNFRFDVLTVAEINRDYRSWIARKLSDVGEHISQLPYYFDKESLEVLANN